MRITTKEPWKPAPDSCAINGEEKPQVSAAPAGDTHPVLVHVKDALTYNQELEIPVDLVVLATGMHAEADR